ncbi:MAG: AI-2E family transporter, partial [Phycisphaeraceae bacterium]|nr:AI-2E family transporter [Phycisphaeraceae bacterium]
SVAILGSIGIMIFSFLLLSFTLYFFYRDGKKIVHKLMVISPIPVHHERQIFKKFNEISRATMYGTFLTAVTQGFVAWIGFMIAGLPSAFFWATAVSVFSFVPVVGTALVWLPAGLIMLASGNIFGGIFILAWGGGLVSTVDNLLRVVFIGSSAKLNPLVTFIAVFGGILAFDLIGVILGPMLIVLLFTLLEIYEMEYAEVLATPELAPVPVDAVVENDW